MDASVNVTSRDPSSQRACPRAPPESSILSSATETVVSVGGREQSRRSATSAPRPVSHTPCTEALDAVVSKRQTVQPWIPDLVGVTPSVTRAR